MTRVLKIFDPNDKPFGRLSNNYNQNILINKKFVIQLKMLTLFLKNYDKKKSII